MTRRNPKYYARALRALTRGKKKREIDGVVRGAVVRFGVTGQMRFLWRVQHALADLLDAEKGIVRVGARIPQCDEKRKAALTAHMTKQIGRGAELSVVQDPSLIAGAVVTVGDTRYDGSVKARIRQLAKHLIV